MTRLFTLTHASQARGGVRAAARSAAAAAALLLSAGAAALGLGDIVQQSALGEPFRAAIRVIADADEVAGGELSPECFRLVTPDSERSGELPRLVFGRATLSQGAAGVQIIVASDAVARDPALSFAVEAGCRLRVRREYTALLDPPIIRDPVVGSVPSPATSSIARSPGSARPSPAPMKSTSSRRARRTASAPAATTGGEVRLSNVGSRRKGNGARLPVEARNAAPQLRVSRTSAGGDPAERKKTDAEIRQEVEAETLVLQRRIAELSLTLTRLDDELRAARAARDAAERRSSAVAAPRGAIQSWLTPALLVAVALALIVMILRALRKPTLRSIGMSALVASTLGPTQSETYGSALNHGPAKVAPPESNAGDDSRPSPMTEPPADDDEEASFDEDLIRYAEQRTAYSVLEREQPKVVATVVREWGKPKVIAYLRDLLVSPRKLSGAFSREAVSDLMFLQALAMERAGYQADAHPWRIELGARRRA